ncbi:MAG: FAD-dependent oxidoreductase [Rhodovibrio sp.]|nr:FAD-dependent oxidoreductase [Rhodovibrio sp.]
MGDLPGKAEVIVVGGGAVGCSIAYHLAHRGCSDVLLLERDRLTSGTTWHAAGLVGQLRGTPNLTRLAQYGTELYENLEAETGQPTGFVKCGSIMLASSEARWAEVRRAHSTATAFGVETELLTPEQVQERWPLIDLDGVWGGLWLPNDGQINPTDLTMALARGARANGAVLREQTPVTRLLHEDGRVVGVATEDGEVRADTVVLAAGMWSRELGHTAGVKLPLHAAEHFYVVTEALSEPPGRLPVLRDPDHAIYVKEDAGKLLVGMFEPTAKPWGMEGIPQDFSFEQLPDDWDHVMPQLEAAAARVPAFMQAGVQTFFNGPESFTPDDRFLLGETPELDGLFVACGFNSIGVQSAGGVGKALADWIVEGHPPMDLGDVDVRRTLAFQDNARYLHDRTRETLGLLYATHWPYRQYDTARNARRSPLHVRLAAEGAVFGEAAGWERPDFFGEKGADTPYDQSFDRPAWFDLHAQEHLAVRNDLGLFDLTSFAKLLVQGPDAQAALDHVCSSRMDVAPGRVVYTLLLNERGGVEADLTVTRLERARYLLVLPATMQRRAMHWLQRHLPRDLRATIADVTAAEAVIGVMGPRARDFLQKTSGADLSNAACPFGHAVEIEVGYAPVRAARISYVGELGWELYVSSEFAAHVLDTLLDQPAPPRPCGFHTLHSMRTESGFRHWGHDMSDEDDPLAAGLGFAVAKDKDFIGRAAVDARRGQPRASRLVSLKLEDPDPLLYHDEPILQDGRVVGRVTSGRYGHEVGAAVGLGWVTRADGQTVDADFLATPGFEIEVAGARVPARLALQPFIDPRRERMRG